MKPADHNPHFSIYTVIYIRIIKLHRWIDWKSAPEVIELFSCLTQLSTKFILLINVKMPTIVGILTVISMINTTSERLKARNFFTFQYFSFYEHLKFCAQWGWAWKFFITSWPESDNGTIRVHHESEGGIENSVPRITNWHQEACQVVTNGDREGRIYLSHPYINNGFFFLLTTKYLFYIGKTWKRLPENPEFTEMQHGDLILTLQWRHGTMCG